jgi:hypothetical protein
MKSKVFMKAQVYCDFPIEIPEALNRKYNKDMMRLYKLGAAVRCTDLYGAVYFDVKLYPIEFSLKDRIPDYKEHFRLGRHCCNAQPKWQTRKTNVDGLEVKIYRIMCSCGIHTLWEYNVSTVLKSWREGTVFDINHGFDPPTKYVQDIPPSLIDREFDSENLVSFK